MDNSVAEVLVNDATGKYFSAFLFLSAVNVRCASIRFVFLQIVLLSINNST